MLYHEEPYIMGDFCLEYASDLPIQERTLILPSLHGKQSARFRCHVTTLLNVSGSITCQPSLVDPIDQNKKHAKSNHRSENDAIPVLSSTNGIQQRVDNWVSSCKGPNFCIHGIKNLTLLS